MHTININTMIKNKKLFNVSYFFVFFLFFLSYFSSFSFADSRSYPADSTVVNAVVGQYYLNLSGFIAPNASVVLIVDGNVLRTVAADDKGYFYFSGVVINKGITQLCFDAIDRRRYGESYSCLNISSTDGDYTRNNIFLPPTFGVQRNQINVGSNAIVWGYSMPNAQVTVSLSDGRQVVVTADSDGFYQVSFKVTKAGSYEFFADATYQNQNSLEPSRKSNFLALSVVQQLGNGAANWFWRLINFLLTNPFGIFFVILPFILLILFLLQKLRPEWFTWVDVFERKLFAIIPLRERKLHHAWFMGY